MTRMDIRAPAPATPCVKICVVDPSISLCIGCGRTVAEISLWSEMSEGERVAVMSGLSARLESKRSRGGRTSRVGATAARRERTRWR